MFPRCLPSALEGSTVCSSTGERWRKAAGCRTGLMQCHTYVTPGRSQAGSTCVPQATKPEPFAPCHWEVLQEQRGGCTPRAPGARVPLSSSSAASCSPLFSPECAGWLLVQSTALIFPSLIGNTSEPKDIFIAWKQSGFELVCHILPSWLSMRHCWPLETR